MALDELSVAVLFASMSVGLSLSDEAVICSDDTLAGLVLAVESVAAAPSMAASAPSASALGVALSLSIEDAASTLSFSRSQCSIVLTDWKNCCERRAKFLRARRLDRLRHLVQFLCNRAFLIVLYWHLPLMQTDNRRQYARKQ